MSRILNKTTSKLLAILVIVLFIIGFRETIITDKNVSAAFGGLMKTLPFCKEISDVICKVLKYQNEIPDLTPAKFIADFLKLAVMAAIQPFAVGLLTMLFLKVLGRNLFQVSLLAAGILLAILDIPWLWKQTSDFTWHSPRAYVDVQIPPPPLF